MLAVQEPTLSVFCFYNAEGNSQLNACNVLSSGTVKSHLLAVTL